MKLRVLFALLLLLFARTSFAQQPPAAPPVLWHLVSTDQTGKPPTAILLVNGQPQTVKIGDVTPGRSAVIAIGADSVLVRTAQGQQSTLYPEDADPRAHWALAMTDTPQGPYALLQSGSYAYPEQRQAVKKGDIVTYDGSLVTEVQPTRVILRLKNGHLVQAPLSPPEETTPRPFTLPTTPYDRPSYFARALSDDNMAEAHALLNADPTVVSKPYNNMLPLDTAVTGYPSPGLFLLLSAGADVNARGTGGQTPLLYALSGRTAPPDILRLLLDKGADVQAQNDAGDTALLLALRYHSADDFTLLLGQGADPTRANAHGDTPLHLAVSANNPEAVQALLARGVAPSVFNHDADLPIHLAMRLLENDHSSSREVIEKMLVDKGARLDVADSSGLTPLWRALLKRDTANVAWLRQAFPKRTPLLSLFQAAADDNVPALTLGLAANADLTEMRGPAGVSLLHVAALWGSRNAAEFLIAHGANPNARDAQNQTPLHDACRFTGNAPIVALLLAQGARPSPKGSAFSDTPLSLAISRIDADEVHLLLAKGADPNDGLYSVSRYPMWSKDPAALDILQSLLDAGADPNLSDFAVSLLGEAVRSGQSAKVRLLFQHGAHVPGLMQDGYRGSLLVAALDSGHEDIALMLLQHGADIGAAGENGALPLFAAARSGETAAVTLLLAKGAEVNARGSHGETALQAALPPQEGYSGSPIPPGIISAHLKIMEMLLTKGADANARDTQGRTALQMALSPAQGYASPSESPAQTLTQWQAIKLLLAHGGSASSKDNGDVPLLVNAIASQTGSHLIELVAALLAHGADVNARGGHGETALIKAITVRRQGGAFYARTDTLAPGRIQIVKLLLAHGADVNAKDQFKQSAITLIQRGDDAADPNGEALIQLLQKAGATDQPPPLPTPFQL